MVDRVPAGVPIVYADLVIDVIYGVHTSKVVFGVETGSGGLRPVGIVAIPTAALLVVAGNIVRDLTSAGIVEETAQRLSGVVTMMREMAPSPVTSKTTKSADKGR